MNKSNKLSFYTFYFVALVSILLISYAFEPLWFEDDAMITMQYGKNFATGCGWNFNCNNNDFATTSILHTFISSILFRIAGEANSALVLVKVYESLVIVLAILAFLRMLLAMGIGYFSATISALCLITNRNTFLYMSSGMENALNLLFLSLTITAGLKNNLLHTGILTGTTYLVRPDSILVGPIMALVDILRGWKRKVLRERFIFWFKVGLISSAIVIVISAIFFITKGTPIPDSGKVKLLTAKNWGYFYEDIAKYMKEELHWMPFCLIGLIYSIRRQSLLTPILIPIILTIIYSIVGLPKSPWYYLPLHLAIFTTLGVGLDFIFRKVLRHGKKVVIGGAMAIIALMVLVVGVRRFPKTKNIIHSVATKRNHINKRTGQWIEKYVPDKNKVAVPNIGYIGFYSGRGIKIIDTVGLVSPDIAMGRRRIEEYRPEVFADKMKYWNHRNKRDYILVAIKGRARYGDERYMIGIHKSKVSSTMLKSYRIMGKQFNLKVAGKNFKLSTLPTNKISLMDGNFYPSDLIITLSHKLLKRVKLKAVRVSLHSSSGIATFLMNRPTTIRKGETKLYLSKDDIVETNNFNSSAVVKIEIDYRFIDPAPDDSVLLDEFKMASFSGCSLKKNCSPQSW